MMRKLVYFIGIVLLLIIIYNLFTFSVDETKKAAVLQFGEIVKLVEKPGLHFKLPFVQRVKYLEDRLLNYDIQPREIYTSDQKRLRIDNYALWRIGDPRKFIEATGGSVPTAQSRLDDIVYSDLRDILAKHTLNEIVSAERLEYLRQVTERSREKLKDFGVELVEVRIKRADLPEEIEQAVFARMRSERERIAAQLRAEGEQRAKEIRSAADRDKEIILAEARRSAEETMGQGDAAALEIYANAYNQDPAFYRFWRSLESYKESFAAGSTIILSTDSDYLRFFESMELIKPGE